MRESNSDIGMRGRPGAARHARRRGAATTVALLVMAGGLLSSIGLTVMVAASAGRGKLTYGDTAESGMTPAESIGIATGVFRGAIVNWLWIRANDLQQEGRFHEAVELAGLITKLQPRFPRVWVFHGWNLAYNISVKTQTFEERWQWVNAGIRLLRNEGLRANPGDLLIHRELAWTFFHKIQGYSDDANQYYKRRIAEEWAIILGNPPLRNEIKETTAQATEKQALWLTKVASAPETIEEVFAAFPKLRETVETLREKDGIDLNTPEGRMKFLEGIAGISSLARLRGEEDPTFETQEQRDQYAQFRAARDALVGHVRKRVLIEDCNMEPDRMVLYTRKYGPLDWRHASTHAIYWAARGSDEALGRVGGQNERDFDFINTDRIIVQAMQDLYRTGTIFYDVLTPDMYMATPCADWIPGYENVLLELRDREITQEQVQRNIDIRQRVYNYYSAGYQNFMMDAIVFIYRRGQIDDAKKMQIRLATWPGLNDNDLKLKNLIQKGTLEEVIAFQIADRAGSPNMAIPEIGGLLMSAYFNGLLANNQEVFKRDFEFAKQYHAAFIKEQNLSAGLELQHRNAVMATDFDIMAGQQLAMVMRTLMGARSVDPRSSAAFVNANSLFTRLPPDARRTQLAAYYFLRKMRPTEADQAQAFDSWFPKPAGYEDFAQAMDVREKLRQQFQGGSREIQ